MKIKNVEVYNEHSTGKCVSISQRLHSSTAIELVAITHEIIDDGMVVLLLL